MHSTFSNLAAAIGICLLGGIAPAFGSTVEPAAEQSWAAWGGEVGFSWNEDLLRDLGIQLDESVRTTDPQRKAYIGVPIRTSGGLEFAISPYNFDHFVGGGLSLNGGFSLHLPDGELSLSNASIRPGTGDARTLQLVGADGEVWFDLDKLMYEMTGQGAQLHVRTMDLRIASALANRLGRPELRGWAVADVRLDLDVFRRGSTALRAIEGSPHWPGMTAGGGDTYKADVFMLDFNAQYTRCRRPNGEVGNCDGTVATTDGEVVFTPNSTLKNNVNNGTSDFTVPGDPMGKSEAMYTADVAWYQKFTAGSEGLEPYHMDQHPYLIWNLYRIDAQGRIEQIGRSGVKHAFLTTNQGAGCDNSNGSHVLGINCVDTYSTGNNDSNTSLGPRSDIVPAKGLWGRCGSIYDANCDQSTDGPGNTSYSQRLITRESQLAAGGTYYFESWYLVRDDVNIYNTMAVRPVTFSFSGAGPWSVVSGNPLRLGPAINRWVDPASTSPNERNVEIANDEGHTRLAVKATDLGGGQWRYDYAIMNFDFARAATSGTPTYEDDAVPANRYRVIHNFGYDRFRVPLPTGVTPSSITFSDGDLNTANDWTATPGATDISWSAPVNAAPLPGVPAVLNALNWGTMFRFSFVANAAPGGNNVTLHIAETGTPQVHVTNLLGPGSDLIFVDNFDLIPQRPND